MTERTACEHTPPPGDVTPLAILGATGSIGQQTLDVVRAFPHYLRVVGLGAGTNAGLLAKQVRQFKPQLVSIESNELGDGLAGLDCELVTAEELAAHPDVELVVIAISGMAGLAPTLAAIRARKRVALATKEALVMAGGIVTGEARRHGVSIMPIDSEPSAIWQCLRGEERGIERLILTASGGPFRHLSAAELEAVTPKQALEHPTWKWGPR